MFARRPFIRSSLLPSALRSPGVDLTTARCRMSIRLLRSAAVRPPETRPSAATQKQATCRTADAPGARRRLSAGRACPAIRQPLAQF